MRNLKRALSLGLTAAMISGLMVMGSSAASSSYTDVADTDNVEAIEVLKSVGIMVGDESGDFNPDQNVTRNEMAVVMSNLMAYNVATYANTSPFTDVPSWAEPYVAACWTNGITAGTSATTYGGSESVTTAQAALMLMKALGYFQYSSDFGSDWQLATTRQGNAIDLFDGVDSGVTQAMTRDDLAQLVLNTLEAGTVEAETDGSISVGDITIVNDVQYKFVTSGRDYATAVNDRLDTNNDGSYSSGAIVELGEKLYQGDLTKEEGYDDFGRPANIWEYQSKEIGTFADDADYTYTAKVTSKQLYNDLGKTAVDNYDWTVSINGEDVNFDGKDLAASKTDDDKDFVEKAGVSLDDIYGGKATGNGVVTEVFVDGTDRTIDVAMIYYYPAEVYEVNDDDANITLSDLGYGPADINDEFDTTDFAEDDIVMYSFANGEIQEVYAAEELNGEVTRVRMETTGGNPSDGDYFVVDGTTYNYNKVMTEDRLVSENVDNNVVAYVDANGYVAYIDESAMTYDYAYVLSVGTDGDQYDDSNEGNNRGTTVYARLVLSDGTMVKAETDLKWSERHDYLNHIVSYNVDSDDVYDLEIRDHNNDPDDRISGTDGSIYGPAALDQEGQKFSTDIEKEKKLNIENGVASFTVNGEDYTANSNTVFVVADTDPDSYDDYDFVVYTGVKNVPDIGYEDTALVDVAADEDGVAKMVYVQDADVSGAGQVIFAVANHNAKLVDDTDTGDYYEISAVVDGEVVTLNVKEGSTAAERLVTDSWNQYGVKVSDTKYIVALDSITENSDGLITNVSRYDALNDGDGYVTSDSEYGVGTDKAENETVKLGNSSDGKRFAWDDEVVVVRYNYKGDLDISRISSIKDDPNDLYVAVLDSNVLTGICIVEKDSGSGSSSSGSNSDTWRDDDITLTVEWNNDALDFEAVNARIANNGNLNYTFATPETWNNGDEVTYDYVVYIDDARVARGSESATIVKGEIDGLVPDLSYDEGDKVEIIISNIKNETADNVTVTADITNATVTVNGKAVADGEKLSFNEGDAVNVTATGINVKVSFNGTELTAVNGVYTFQAANGTLTVTADPAPVATKYNLTVVGANYKVYVNNAPVEADQDTPAGAVYVIEENSSVAVQTSSLTVGNSYILADGVTGTVDSNKNLVFKMTNNVSIDLNSLVAGYTVTVGEGITLTDAEGNEVETGSVVPAGAYTVASETGRYFVKTGANLGELYAVNTIQNIVAPATTATITISGETEVYAGVKVTGNSYTNISYIDENGDAQGMNLGASNEAYAAMGATLKVEHTGVNGVYNAADGNYGKEVSTYEVTKNDVKFATGYKVTLGDGVTAEINGETVSNTTIVVKNVEKIDTLVVDETKGTTAIWQPTGSVPYASSKVDKDVAINTSGTLVAATEVAGLSGMTVEYRVGEGDHFVTGPTISGTVYVKKGTVLEVSKSSGDNVVVEGAESFENNNAPMIIFTVGADKVTVK